MSLYVCVHACVCVCVCVYVCVRVCLGSVYTVNCIFGKNGVSTSLYDSLGLGIIKLPTTNTKD